MQGFTLNKNMHGVTFENITVAVLWRVIYRELKVEAGRYVRRLLLDFHRMMVPGTTVLQLEMRSG